MRLARSSATAGPTARTMQKRATSQWDIVVLPLRTKQSNDQAFIRRASRMADKTSWTKPLAPMTYGDSIVRTTSRDAVSARRASGGRDQGRPGAEASTPDERHDGMGRGVCQDR